MVKLKFLSDDDRERDPDKSSSKLGQWIYDHLPHDMFFSDIDGVSYANCTDIMRELEMKRPGQRLKPSQQVILYKHAAAMRLLVQNKMAAPGSAVFVVYTVDPDIGADVQLLTKPGAIPPRFTLEGQEWHDFLRARPVPRVDAAVREWTNGTH